MVNFIPTSDVGIRKKRVMGKKQHTDGFVIDKLLSDFRQSVDHVAHDTEKTKRAIHLLKVFNPEFKPIFEHYEFPEANLLANVVAAIYAPLIHGFSSAVLNNIRLEILPHTLIFPLRDAIPLMESCIALANIHQIPINPIPLAINRHIAGIENNQQSEKSVRDSLLDRLFEQTLARVNGDWGVVELETGVYGTVSLVIAQALKEKGIRFYTPIKFYGLGPNLSFVHAVLSNHGIWVAEQAENRNLVNPDFIHDDLMTLFDSLEEIGMKNYFNAFTCLRLEDRETVQPVIELPSLKELCVAHATNKAVRDTATQYAHITSLEVKTLLTKVPWLVKQSRLGFPFTLTAAIPPMNGKEAHFHTIRKARLFDYPDLSALS